MNGLKSYLKPSISLRTLGQAIKALPYLRVSNEPTYDNQR